MVESLFDFQWCSQTGPRLSDCLREIRCKCLIFSGFVLLYETIKWPLFVSYFWCAREKKGTPRPSTPVLECWLLKTRRIGNLIEMEKCIRRRHVKCAGRSFLWNLLKPFYMLILSWKWNEITCTVVSKRSLFIVFFLLWQSIRIVTAAQLLRFIWFSTLNYESAGSNFILVDIVTYSTRCTASS